MNMDWTSSSTEVLLNPRLSTEDKKLFSSSLPRNDEFKSHVWIATSGSSGLTKFAALSKTAILTSANAVNEHLESGASDCWLHMLPDFHVGGLGIWARAFLSGAKVVDLKSSLSRWDPACFYQTLIESKATLTALVPTQIYDLVSRNLRPPASLRAVIIGGGGLSPALFEEVENLGWNLLPSYGLTECASQVATAKKGGALGYGSLLSHVKVKIDEEGYIEIKSPSLLSAYCLLDNGKVSLVDPKEDGWFKTEDKGEINEDGLLKVHGRGSDFVKIGGESCSLVDLRMVLDEVISEESLVADVVIAAVPDARLGHVIHLFSDKNNEDLKSLVENFNVKVLPFARIREIKYVEKIPRSPLGKVLYSQLTQV